MNAVLADSGQPTAVQLTIHNPVNLRIVRRSLYCRARLYSRHIHKGPLGPE